MLRKAVAELLRDSKGCSKALTECPLGFETSLIRVFSTSSTSESKRKGRPKKENLVPDAAAEVLNKPALVQGFSAIPPEPKFLGLAGALPFLMLSPPIAAGVPFMPPDFVSNAAALQIGYGASIASFLGGIHWALAMANYGRKGIPDPQANTERYIWSVMPCLLAWPAVTMQPGPGSFVAAVALAAAYVVDNSFARKALLPSWYMSLRLPLTLAAVGGLSITCASSFTSYVPQRGAIASADKPEEL